VISAMRNLGKKSHAMLAAAGITSEKQLRECGAAAAFLAVKKAGAKPSLNLLWAIEGALTDCDWKDIAKTERLSLLTQVESMEGK
jgi:DNA transformation protein and related proteins